MACRFQLVNATLKVRATQNNEQICEVFWKISMHSFYGHFMDDFCFKVILLYHMKI